MCRRGCPRVLIEYWGHSLLYTRAPSEMSAGVAGWREDSSIRPVGSALTKSLIAAVQWAETISYPDDRLDASACMPQFLPEPTNVHIQCACARFGYITTDLHQQNRFRYNLPSVLHQKRQQAVLTASQSNYLAVKPYHFAPQVYE